MSGNCTCNQIQAASKGRGIIATEKQKKHLQSEISEILHEVYVTSESPLVSGNYVCVSAYTKTDGTHTTTAGMRNVRTETHQPAFWQGRSSAKDSSHDAQDSNLEQPMKNNIFCATAKLLSTKYVRQCCKNEQAQCFNGAYSTYSDKYTK